MHKLTDWKIWLIINNLPIFAVSVASFNLPRSKYQNISSCLHILFIMAKHDEKRSWLCKQMVFTAKVIDSCWAFFYNPASAALTWSGWRNIVISVGNALQQAVHLSQKRDISATHLFYMYNSLSQNVESDLRTIWPFGYVDTWRLYLPSEGGSPSKIRVLNLCVLNQNISTPQVISAYLFCLSGKRDSVLINRNSMCNVYF